MAQTRTPGTSRLPSTRESRPAMIGLAILLIVGGALASGYLALQAGNRASYVVVERGVAPGARITADDLGRVSLPEDYQGGVPSGDAGSVVNRYATVRLLPGTVLSPRMISKSSGVDANQSQLTVPLDDASFIKGLQPGAQLALNIAASDSATTGGGGSGSSGQSVFAELVSVNQPAEGGGIGGGTGSDSVTLVVSIDISCLSTVAAGVQNQAIVPALIGDADSSTVQRTCRG